MDYNFMTEGESQEGRGAFGVFKAAERRSRFKTCPWGRAAPSTRKEPGRG